MELSQLRPLYERSGPWASVYLDASRSTEDAARRLDLRWRGFREDLLRAGAPERDCAAVETVLDEVRPEGQRGLAVFAAGGEVHLSQELPRPPVREMVSWSALPRVVPMIAALPEQVRWIRVLIDRLGADVQTPTGIEPVPGSQTYPVHKSGQGGWSQLRYERAAETTWDRNANEVAAALTEMVDRDNPDVVLVAGDVRARQLLREWLPQRVATRVVEAPGSRAAGFAEPLDEATETAVAAVGQRHRQELLERFYVRAGRGEAVEGVSPVAAAARSGALDVLLLDPDLGSGEVWVDPAQPQLVTTAEPGPRNGAIVRESAAEALVAAASMTDAELLLLHGEVPLADGVGAAVRYPPTLG